MTYFVILFGCRVASHLLEDQQIGRTVAHSLRIQVYDHLQPKTLLISHNNNKHKEMRSASVLEIALSRFHLWAVHPFKVSLTTFHGGKSFELGAKGTPLSFFLGEVEGVPCHYHLGSLSHLALLSQVKCIRYLLSPTVANSYLHKCPFFICCCCCLLLFFFFFFL